MTDTPAARAQIIALAKAWLGTPYHHHARVQGVGVDCAQLLCAVYASAGIVAPVDPGYYPHDHHLHRTHELYIEWLERCGARETTAAQPGDIALFRFGKTWSHGGILVEPGAIVHALQGVGTVFTRLTESPLAGRPARFWTFEKACA